VGVVSGNRLKLIELHVSLLQNTFFCCEIVKLENTVDNAREVSLVNGY
jgi:hypothetical protein